MFLRSCSAVLAATALTLSLSGHASAAVKTFALDPTHTDVIWAASHFGFSDSHGKFSDVSGTIVFNEDAPELSTVEVTIHTASVTTGIEKFDTHLRSEDFFGSAEFPEATFVSESITPTGEKTADIAGKFTLKGKTKDVIIKATLNKQGINLFNRKETLGFNGETSIRRSDYGISYALPGIPDMVKITIAAEATIQKQKDAAIVQDMQVAALVEKQVVENTQEISDDAIVVANDASHEAVETANDVQEATVDVIDNAKGAASEAAESAQDTASDVVQTTSAVVSKPASHVNNAVFDVSESVAKKASDAKDTVAETVEASGDTVSDIVAAPMAAEDAAESTTDKLIDKASEVAEDISEATKSAYDSAVQKWNSWRSDDISDKAADAVENAGDAIEDAADNVTQ